MSARFDPQSAARRLADSPLSSASFHPLDLEDLIGEPGSGFPADHEAHIAQVRRRLEEQLDSGRLADG